MRHQGRSWIRVAGVLLAAAAVPACSKDSFHPPATSVLLKSMVVGPAGATVAVTDPASPALGTEVVIPPGALAAPTTITLSQVVLGSAYPSDVLDFEFGPSGTIFATPVTVTVKYGPGYLSKHGISDPTILRIVESSSLAGTEVLATSSQDAVNRTLSATTTHFSNFAVLGYTNQTLNGDYTLQVFSVDNGDGSHPPNYQNVGFFCNYGTATFDGFGNVTFTLTQEKYDQTFKGGGVVSGTYSVAADGSVSFPTGGGLAHLTGGVLAGGSSLILRNTDPLDLVQVLTAVKKGSALTNAALNGVYDLQIFSVDDATTTGSHPANNYANAGFFVDYGTMTFDGAGTVTITITQEKYDQTFKPGSTPSGTYSVAANGAVTFPTSGGLTHLAGGIDPAGKVLMLTNTDQTDLIQIATAVKRGSALGNATLHGTYHLQVFSVDDAPFTGSRPANLFKNSGFFVDFGSITFNGSGSYSFVITEEKYDQTFKGGAVGSGTYSVAADGVLTFAGGDAAHLTGCVSPDGNFIHLRNTDQFDLVQIALAIHK